AAVRLAGFCSALFLLLVQVWIAFSSFFFSSRRRHTRWPRDWSSDVCSSDLSARGRISTAAACGSRPASRAEGEADPTPKSTIARSEERRVGKECRADSWAGHEEQVVH